MVELVDPVVPVTWSLRVYEERAMDDDYGIPREGWQDPIYGIKRVRIVERLTASNWWKKAVVRERNPDSAALSRGSKVFAEQG